MTKLRFISVPGAVSDAGELLAGLAHEARALGAEVEEGRTWEVGGDGVAVFAPGDTFGIPGAERPAPRQLRRAIGICEDAPTGPLDVAYLNARRCAAAITPDALGSLALRAIAHEQVSLGPSDAWRPERAAARDIDVACLARRGVHADRYLASFSRTLWRRRSWLLGAPEVPTGAEGEVLPPLPLGSERGRLLARTSVVLLGLGEEGPEVERLRALQATAAGAVIVAPHGLDLAPLTPGRDHAVAEARNLAIVADSLLEEPAELERLRSAAAGALADAAGLREAAESLLGLARRVGEGRVQPGAASTRARAQSALSRSRDVLRGVLSPPPNPVRVAAKRAALEEIAERRRAAARAAGGDDPGRAEALLKTPAYEAAEPRITVCIPVYEHAGPLRRALASACSSGRDDVEVLVLDDGSGPETVAAAKALVEGVPWMPAMLLGRSANRGLGPGRTDMARHARGELLFMLDADNEVYPTAFERLVAALDDDPQAAFAYSLVEAHTEGRSRGLLSASPWDVLRLRRGNYIDAMSMIRRSALLDAGGYTDDVRLHGWEDFDLWCRFAARGMRGLLVPEVLCRYSLSEASMISITNLDSSEAWALLGDLYPEVLGGAPLPTYPPPPPDVEL